MMDEVIADISKDKPKKNKLLLWLILILVLAIIAFLVIVYAKKGNLSVDSMKNVFTKTDPAQTAKEEEPVVVADETVDITSAWKAYTNSGLGVSLRYPTEFIGEGGSANGVSFINKENDNIGLAFYNTDTWVNTHDLDSDEANESENMIRQTIFNDLSNSFDKKRADSTIFAKSMALSNIKFSTAAKQLQYIETSDSAWRGVTYIDTTVLGDLPFGYQYKSYMLNKSKNLVAEIYFQYGSNHRPAQLNELNTATSEMAISANTPIYDQLISNARTGTVFDPDISMIDSMIKTLQ